MKRWLVAKIQVGSVVASGFVLAVTGWLTPAMAGDPFRDTNPHKIGESTEAAFLSVFQHGNYAYALVQLQQARASEPNEPMHYALQASVEYLEQDWDAFLTYSEKTLETAEKLVEKDPLRGHTYMAVGHFLIGAHQVLTEDIGGVTQAMGKLRPIFRNLSKAEEISAQDPELNLIRGYMDLMLAVNLPFANPDEAIKRMEEYGKPSYVAYRGIAIGYRDLEKADQARKYVDKALAMNPENPDLLYLKAQILLHQGEKEKSLQYFQAALARRSQLLPRLDRQIAYEHCRLATDLADRDRSICHRLLD